MSADCGNRIKGMKELADKIKQEKKNEDYFIYNTLSYV